MEAGAARLCRRTYDQDAKSSCVRHNLTQEAEERKWFKCTTGLSIDGDPERLRQSARLNVRRNCSDGEVT